MNYKKLGNTDLDVSTICLGTMTWGEQNTQDEGFEQMDYSLDHGINFFDTAELYAVPPKEETYGDTEEIIGNWFQKTKKRDKIILATKVAGPARNYLRGGQNSFVGKNLDDALEASLKRLKTDYIDLYQLHDPKLSILQDDTRIIETLESLQQDGKIRIIGISTKSPEESLIAIEQFNFKGVQVNFNLIDQRALDNGLFNKCEELGVGIIGRTPLCFGFLTGKYGTDDKYDSSDHRSLWSREQISVWANAYKLFSKEFSGLKEQTTTQIALRFCLSYPMLSTTIPGMLTKEHVDENTSSSNYGIYSDSQLQKFRKIYQKNDFFVKAD